MTNVFEARAGMVDIDVTLVRANSRHERIRRPLHRVGGGYAVTFKGKKWPIDSGLHLDLRVAEPLPDDTQARFASHAEAQELVRPPLAEIHTQQPSQTVEVLVVTPATDPASHDFDPSQNIVIQEAETARQLVDAGPGTGKTAVACARVAWLASYQKIPPAQIWLISFTRTAVQEIRDRVARLLDRSIANAVQMATLDSMAWQLNSGFRPGARLTGSFEDNIRALHGELDENLPVQDYLQELRHLIIDEAQDIVGLRAELLVSLIEILPPSCGVTVFSDEAQSIYGFAAADQDDNHGDDPPEASLARRLRESSVTPVFTSRALAQVHRTSDPNLKTLFTQVRLEVLEPTTNALKRNHAIRQRLKELSHAAAPTRIEDTAADLPDDAFVLFRRRIEAIKASASLKRAGIPHRVRMSGLPVTVSPWIAAALGQADEPRVGERGFSKLWADNVAKSPMATIAPDTAFQLLRNMAPDTTNRMIDLRLLRNRLAGRPPLALAHAELGHQGPIIGTIHASKGREASSVTLMMPGPPSGEASASGIDEETRVLFVAATRARQQLRIAEVPNIKSANTEDGRAYRFSKWNGNPKCDFELGRAGDLDAVGIAGRSYFADRAVVIANQRIWIELAAQDAAVEVYLRKIGDDWPLCVCAAYGGETLAVLGKHVDDELWDVVRRGVGHFQLEGQPYKPRKLASVHVVGLTTIAVGADNSDAELLLEPWKSTGLVLAPLLYGLPRFTVKTREN